MNCKIQTKKKVIVVFEGLTDRLISFLFEVRSPCTGDKHRRSILSRKLHVQH